LLALAILSSAEEEKKAVKDSKVEESKAEELADKKQDKRGIHDFGDWSSSSSHDSGHDEKTLTIIKKVPVPVPHYKTVHVPVVKEVKYPVHVHVPKPVPVVKHVR
jgi:hypothetical protein